MILAHVLLAAAVGSLDAEIARRTQGVEATVVAVRREIHQHPELSNREFRTGRLVSERLRGLGLDVRYPVAKTGVVAALHGAKPGPIVAVRADLDALPIEETLDVPYKSRQPGIKHACGHDAHTAIVLGVAEVLSGLRHRLRGTVVFLFQPAEEGAPEGEEGGAALMMREGALMVPKAEAILGLHVDPQLDVGQVGYCEGPIFASSDRFQIEVKGRRTHGAYPHTGVDPIPIAAAIVQALQTMVAREVDAQDPKVVSIGQIHGGNRFNILAESVTLEGTIRALSPSMREDVKSRVERAVCLVAEGHGGVASVRYIGQGLPPVLNARHLVGRLAPTLIRVLGPEKAVTVRPQMGAEDFALYAERLPAFYVKLGVRNRERGVVAMVHTEAFDIDESALSVGVRVLSTMVIDLLAAEGP